jgi:predicted ATP-grasp superfamily ATP-dependent carboligase
MEPALVVGAHTVGLGITRALGRKGVPVISFYYDDEDIASVSRYVKESIRVPHPEKHEDQFIESLISIASRYGGSLLMPASDPALAAISRHKHRLDPNYTVACTEWGITKLIIDKQYTYALAHQIGVAAPKTAVPHSTEDVEEYAEAVQYPCLVKPTQSHRYFDVFRTKMVKVGNYPQMLAAYRQAADAGFEVMLQEFIPGDATQGANYNSYSWGGKALVEFTAAKIRNAPRETGSPSVALSQHIPEVIEPGRKILQALGFYGYACTEFKRDPRDGLYKLVDINGRHNLSSLLAVRSGINFPWIHYEHLVRGKLPSPSDFQTGIYWIDLIRDISCAPEYFLKEGYTPAQYLRPYLSPHVFAILDSADPKPFGKRCVGLARTALRRLHVPRHHKTVVAQPLGGT